MSADTINITGKGSASKGESLRDTASIDRHGRHCRSSWPAEPATRWRRADASVINAGDGTHEHSTQALLDAYTIEQRLGDPTVPTSRSPATPPTAACSAPTRSCCGPWAPGSPSSPSDADAERHPPGCRRRPHPLRRPRRRARERAGRRQDAARAAADERRLLPRHASTRSASGLTRDACEPWPTPTPTPSSATPALMNCAEDQRRRPPTPPAACARPGLRRGGAVRCPSSTTCSPERGGGVSDLLVIGADVLGGGSFRRCSSATASSPRSVRTPQPRRAPGRAPDADGLVLLPCTSSTCTPTCASPAREDAADDRLRPARRGRRRVHRRVRHGQHQPGHRHRRGRRADPRPRCRRGLADVALVGAGSPRV